MEKKIRILFLVNGFSIGGGELKLLELVRELTQNYSREFQCTVCSVGSDGPLKGSFEALGIRTEVFLKAGPYDFTQIIRVIRLIRDLRPDMVQTTLFYADVIGTYAAKAAGIRSVISWEAVTQPYALKHLLAYRLAAKWFTVSVTVSRAIQRQVVGSRHVQAGKTYTIPYGVDLVKFSSKRDNSLRLELGLNLHDFIIGTVARLTEQKGHRYLVQAIPAVLSKRSDVHFVFAGDGPLSDDLKEQVNSLGVQKHVHFLGFRNDVEILLRNFNLFVLPSLYEGLPNVVLEAMASRLPVIATAVDGTPEAVIHPVTGLLIPPRSPEAIEEAICSLLNDRRLLENMGKAGRNRIENCYSLQTQVRQFVQLYQSLFTQEGSCHATDKTLF